jgi:hypothetical protein
LTFLLIDIKSAKTAEGFNYMPWQRRSNNKLSAGDPLKPANTFPQNTQKILNIIVLKKISFSHTMKKNIFLILSVQQDMIPENFLVVTVK